VSAACERKVVAVDLRDDWARSLLDAGYRPDAPVVWLAEGLLFYLPETAVCELLDTTAKLSCIGSALGTDTMAAEMLAAESVRAWTRFMADAGAPLVFGTDSPAELLAERGWQPTLHSYSDVAADLGRSWAPPSAPAPGGMIITATVVG
jgi:methyltransferase (TIGR00027 family)